MPDHIDRNTKITLGLAMAMLAAMSTAMWQASALRAEVKDQLAEARVKSTSLSGDIAVLGEKVSALEKSQDAFRNDIRSSLADLKAEVKEVARRIP
jgi:predicted  nucleic acid-binding Zn-ribbon protein